MDTLVPPTIVDQIHDFLDFRNMGGCHGNDHFNVSSEQAIRYSIMEMRGKRPEKNSEAVSNFPRILLFTVKLQKK